MTKSKLPLPEHLIGIDLFSGAGGLSLGAELAGIHCSYAIEAWEAAAKTYQLNHPGTKVIASDIATVDPQSLCKGKHTFIVMGGPPCQGFSTLNHQTSINGRTADNPKNHLYKYFLKFVEDIRPDWVVFENVPGFINFESIASQVTDSLVKYGYKVAGPQILQAANYGVPQTRSRCFIVANRLGIEYAFPEPTGTLVTVRDAIADLPILANGNRVSKLRYRIIFPKSSKYAQLMRRNTQDLVKVSQNIVPRNCPEVRERLKSIPQGGCWKDIPDGLIDKDKHTNRHSNVYNRLKYDAPSSIIINYAKNLLIHPSQHRCLSAREAARLQSFPDDYCFEGRVTEVVQQIANAVPPLLSKAIMSQILSYYE